jgi:hypothetical protein
MAFMKLRSAQEKMWLETDPMPQAHIAQEH